MDPVAQLLARDQHGIKFGLDNIRALCAALGHPERSWTSLLVAGTNGKGSVTAMAAAALTAAGHRTGRYTSPHLVRIEERFAIDGVVVHREALAEAAAAALEAEARCLRSETLQASVTFFEITTATAFELFRRAGAQAVVLEVGMGGRFDATNASEPAVSAITSIDLDHTRFLGDTLAAIAFEKAGVLRAGRAALLGPLPTEALDVVRRVAAERGARLIEALGGVDLQAEIDGEGRTRMTLRTPGRDYGTVTLALRGRHQVANAVVAVRLLEEASAAGLVVPAGAVRTGLEETSWPARLQIIALANGARVLLDAAHNPAGAATLASYLSDTGAGRVPILFGAMADKDVGGMLRVLAPHASRFVFASAHSPRAMPPADLLAIAAAHVAVPCLTAPTPVDGLHVALADGSLAVVAGSIFLIGDLLSQLPELDGAPQADGVARRSGAKTSADRG